MNKCVTFPISKLLKEKGFEEKPFYVKSKTDYIEGYVWDLEDNEDYLKTCEFQFEDNIRSHYYLKPTIGDVLMWLYENHKIWILALPTITGHFTYKILDVQLDPEKPIERPPYKDVNGEDFISPYEAYEAGIEYCLNNILK